MKSLILGAAAALSLMAAIPAHAQGSKTTLTSTNTSTSTASEGYAGAGGLNTTGGAIGAYSLSAGVAGAQAGPSGSTSYTMQGSQGSSSGKNTIFSGGANDVASAHYGHYVDTYTHSHYGMDP